MRKTHRKQKDSHSKATAPKSGLWLYGKHAVLAALANKSRHVKQLLVSKQMATQLPKHIASQARIVDNETLNDSVPPQAVHQGIVASVELLSTPSFEEVAAKASRLLWLDQVTDPQNIGAILRSAAAFGFDAVIMQDRHSPSETGAMAKAACGAVDMIPVIKVTNIARSIDEAKEHGFWIVGLDGYADTALTDVKPYDKTGVVMGAEGAGVRDAVLKACDIRSFIAISPAMESLNVSVAAALSMHHFAKISHS